MVLSSIYESLRKYMGEYHFLNPSISTILLNDCGWESLGHAVNHYRLIKPNNFTDQSFSCLFIQVRPQCRWSSWMREMD
jgi:hypothetical protein